MITKLLLKILFKATVPLVAVVGIASYALYTAGGDPLSVLKQVGGGFGERVGALAGSAGSSIDAAREQTASTFSGDESAAHQTLYRWKDENGVTHFSNTPPEDGQAVDEVSVDPNRNLMSPPKQAVSTTRVRHDSSRRVNEAELTGDMPGMAGVLGRGLTPSELIGQFTQSRSENSPAGDLPGTADGSANPAELLKQFKQSQESRLRQIP